MKQHIELPDIQQFNVTDEIISHVNSLIKLLDADNIVQLEKDIFDSLGIHPRKQQRIKGELRKMFAIPARTSLAELTQHPQIRPALITILMREEREDKGTLRAAKEMVVIEGDEFKKKSVEQFLIAQYSFPGSTAQSAFNAFLNMIICGRVYKEFENAAPVKCVKEDMPSIGSITRFLRIKREGELNMPLKKAKSTRGKFDALNFFVRQNPEEFRVRGYVELDHTETDVEIVRTDTGVIDRFWHTSVVDFHSSLACGYNLTFQPNSLSIALAVRNAMLGNQLKIATPGFDDKGNPTVVYQAIPEPADFCDFVKMDNGKDFRSHYTNQIFGKIDIQDDMRRSLNQFCEVKYAQPYHPQSKPHVERSFGVMNMFWKMFPGYTGKNYMHRPEELKQEKKDGQLLTDIQFIQLFELAWNVYNNKPMKRLKGMSRIQYYLSKRTTTKNISERVLDLLLMKSDKHPQVRGGWIVIDTVEYFSHELTHLHGQKVDVFYDPNNIGFVHCYYNNAYVATAINREMFGRTQKENLDIVKLRGRKDTEHKKIIKDLRGGMTHLEAKSNSFMGMLHNVVLTPLEQLQSSTPSVTTLTKLEQQATVIAEKTKSAEDLVEMEQKAKKKFGGRLLTADMINKL